MSFSNNTLLNNLLGYGEDYLAILECRDPNPDEGMIGYAFINTITNQKFIKVSDSTWELANGLPLQFSTGEYFTFSTGEYFTFGL